MKHRNVFIIIIVVFLVVMFFVYYKMPQAFVWEPTFNHSDSQPFGCYVFDKVLKETLPNGYSTTDKNLYYLSREKTNKPRGILIVSSENELSNTDVNDIDTLLKRGNKVMVVGVQSILTEAMNVKYLSFRTPNVEELSGSMSSSNIQEKLHWVDRSKGYKDNNFFFFAIFCNSYFTSYDSIHMRPLVMEDTTFQDHENYDANNNTSEYAPIALACPYDKGEIILVSTPLLFTNYGILDKHNSVLIYRILNEMKGMPIVRTEAYGNNKITNVSPFRYFMSQPPLRWALYLTFLAIILFMCFTAKRKQRIIPIYSKPENKSLEFIKLVGTLYFQKTNNIELLREKYKLFAERLQQYLHIDILNTSEDEQSFKHISQESGIEVTKISDFFKEIRPYIDYDMSIDVKDMKRLINIMNKIINLI